ncbi:MAG: FAD-binding protein [Alphaproteobacteria bacterium]|jgi:D-lactate dehydrogenase (cytochrome)|nr:FAD-binding protein [Alphaproteobacteria bacterium]MBT7943155.1 FAD-binding protein [Alphaproteobacteria bacterium]
MAAPKRINDDLMDALRDLLGDRMSAAQAVREQHGHDESYHEGHAPDLVVFPNTTEEVSEIVTLCAARDVPVIPFGTGTALEGGVAALSGGVTIDLMGMNEIVRINAEDMDVSVQPGVTRKALNEHLRATGLFFPIDPGADASLGGMTATRASGTNAVRYGTMRDNVLAMTVVLADGRIIKTSRRARKSAAGYDLTRLFVGSEGTLGVITEITLRLHGIPEAVTTAVCSFNTVEPAINTVITTIQSGVPVARVEFLDEVQMQAMDAYSDLDYEARPTLIFEFHGTKNGIKEQVETVKDIAADFGAPEFRWVDNPEDRSRLWQARHDAYYACLALKPGTKGMATDVCVPISRLAECIVETRKDIDENGILAPIVGHVGDGNFHVVLLIDMNDKDDLARCQAFNERLVMRALAMEGTCTGEHGVGFGKIDFLTAEHGEAISVMRAVKMALDPQNIMNPGKIVRV